MEKLSKGAPEYRPDRIDNPPVSRLVDQLIAEARAEGLTGSITFTFPMNQGVIGKCKISTERYFNVRSKKTNERKAGTQGAGKAGA